MTRDYRGFALLVVLVAVITFVASRVIESELAQLVVVGLAGLGLGVAVHFSNRS